eukprot:COSAG02_NODE_1233_length_13749_cov_13.003223_9_plen_103_part_00
MAGAESGGLGGMTADHSDEQSGQDGVAAEGDHDGGRPPGDVSSGETVLLHAVNNGGRSDWGGARRETELLESQGGVQGHHFELLRRVGTAAHRARPSRGGAR